MKKVDKQRSDVPSFVRAVNWMNRKLMPYVGPPALGPYGEPTLPTDTDLCPVCAHPMGEHTIDHSTANAILHCPVEPVPGHGRDDTTPLNELGMPLVGDRRARRSNA